MKRMTRMGSKKSHSWWWNSHISPKNSRWLEENLEEMDRCVKEMLKLIEEEGDSFAKKAEMYYKRRPELISHVEDFYRMYRALAERYDHVTGELRRSIPSDLQSQGSGSDFGSGPPSPSLLPSPELTPERKPPRPKLNPRAAGFDFFLGSGGSSDLSRKGSDGSSSSDSDSDSDDSKEGSHNDTPRRLEFENELCDAKDKLHEHEEKGSNGLHERLENRNHVECSSKISALENKLIAADEKLQVAESEISSLKQKLGEKNTSPGTGDVEPNLEKKQLPELEELAAHYKKEIEDLKGAMEAATTRFEADLSQDKTRLEAQVTNLEGAIEKVKSEISKISQEKSQLQSRITEQEHMIQELESNAASSGERFLREKSALDAQVSGLSLSHASLEAKLISLEGEVKRVEADNTGFCAEHGEHIQELNKNLDALKLKADMLTSEKEELGAKLGALVIDVKCRDERIGHMNEHMHQLHLEHAKLITEIAAARKAGEELRARVEELEQVTDSQRVAILDGAERKREAIRQLCFSLEHYRDGYHHLRQVLQGHKRHAVIAA